MNYVYHWMPPEIVGSILYPLNQLKDVLPEVYARAVKKYEGREKLLEDRIPLLGNCLWNDVLFLMAVPPSQFREAFDSVGLVRKTPFRFYEIPLELLDQHNLAVLIEMKTNLPEVYEPFNIERLAAYATMPPETLAYWKESKERDEDKPFLFLHIPHLLYRGTIDVSSLQIIEV